MTRCASQVGECVATWYRPHFEETLYPYVPPHITRPKETRRIFVVHLPEKCYFAARPCAPWRVLSPALKFPFSQVPKNLKLLAVPLFELFQNERYGSVIGSVPQVLSRFPLLLASPADEEDKK
jgi:cleavage and polyadenylation specificity factor subunit 5